MSSEPAKDQKPRQASFQWTGPDMLAKESDLVAAFGSVIADAKYR